MQSFEYVDTAYTSTFPTEYLSVIISFFFAYNGISACSKFFQRARASLLDAGIFIPRHDITAGALQALVRSQACQVEDVSVGDTFRSDVPRFLNRLLGIEPIMQRHIFDFYQAITDRIVQYMKQVCLHLRQTALAQCQCVCSSIQL